MRSFAGCGASLLVGALLAGNGCSDPRKPSTPNFAKAIQTYLDGYFPRCILTGNFPAETVMLDFVGTNQALHALAAAGVLKKSPGQRKGQFTYDLTEEGKKAFVPKDAGEPLDAGHARGGICVGKGELVEVIRFTEPADLLGVHASQVSYNYKVTGLPPWTANPALEKVSHFRDLKRWRESSRAPLNAQDAVVLASDGWVHERLLRQNRTALERAK